MKFLRALAIVLLIMCMLTSCDFFNWQGTNSTNPTTSSSTTSYREVIQFDPDADVISKPSEDPYANMTEEEFYEDYTPATSYWDAYFRTQHYFMSGSIDEQDQRPYIAKNQPKENGLYVRNTSALYSSDGNIYYVIDSQGNVVNKIFKGGAYVTLEDVAAYVFAFGDVPPNYTYDKFGYPSSDPWGKYLRLNHSEFSGDTDRYPYEPVLPDISGCGGDLYYYEIDIGTTGTDCDPDYASVLYNNGRKITRGAARIVYTRYDRNGNQIIDLDEKYLFYTYNHYNDFQEYLNYEGGWGEMFGNITGGGTISSRYDYNPTPYVAVIRKNLYKGATDTATIEYIELAFIYFDRKYYYDNTFCG